MNVVDIQINLDQMKSTLSKVEDIINNFNIENYFKYFEKDYHEVKYLNHITYSINGSFVELINELFKGLQCNISFNEEDYVSEDYPRFKFCSQILGVIGTIESPNHTLYLDANAFGKTLSKRGLGDLKRYYDHLVKIEEIAKINGFTVIFS